MINRKFKILGFQANLHIHYYENISKSQENHIQTISYRNRVFIILIYSGCCHSAVLYALAETLRS